MQGAIIIRSIFQSLLGFSGFPSLKSRSFQITSKYPLHVLHICFNLYQLLKLQLTFTTRAPNFCLSNSCCTEWRPKESILTLWFRDQDTIQSVLRSLAKKAAKALLVDEKGLTMKAVLFGHNVDYFDEIFSENQCYDMSNLVVSAVDPSFQSYPDEKQIHINTSSSIKKVDADNPSTHFTSKLSKISELPRHLSPYNATFDMIVVVLHVTPTRKVHNKFNTTESDLSELYITDDSCSEAVLLSLWNEYALACEKFGDTAPCGVVIALTGLKIKDFKGFSLSTTYHSKIDLNPIGTRADELRKWFQDNRDTLLQL